MSVHTEWIKQLEVYKRNVKASTGADLQLPPPSVLELGLEYLEIIPGEKMVARVPFQKKFTNPVGLYQGGILGACIDDVFGPLSYTTAQMPCLTLSMNLTFLRAFSEEMKECRISAIVLQKTKSFIFMRAEVTGPKGEIIAHAESHVTIMRNDQMQKVKV